MAEQDLNQQIRPLIPFFMLAFGIAWLIWLPFVLPGLGAYRITDTLQSLMTPDRGKIPENRENTPRSAWNGTRKIDLTSRNQD